jgi:DNA-binding LacI/PurR family transcriptional regulator/AraC-like DNA-binding protein
MLSKYLVNESTSDSSRQNKKKRLTFGLLTDSTDSSYHVDVLSGITDFVQDHDINLFIFIGGVFQSSNINEYRNNFYSLANVDNVDGLLVLTPTLGTNIGPQGMSKVLSAFKPLPIVSIATRLPGITSVIINNRSGLSDLLIHFIEDHGCRRFACIRGPAHVPDAEERFRIFADIMKQYNIPIEKDLIIQGPYGTNFGIKAVKILLDNRKRSFDALISSNDDTALGVIEELKRRGISVPKDIRIAGFDDIAESTSFIPRLTTVHQPIYRIGRTACEILYNLIKGKKTKVLTKLPTELVIRESCGCTYPERIKTLHKKIIPIDFAQKKKAILKELKHLNIYLEHGRQKAGRIIFEKILDSFFNDLVLKDRGSFLKEWSEFLKLTQKQHYNFRIINRISYILRERLFPFVYDYRNPSYLFKICAKSEELIENLFMEREMDRKIKNSDMEVKLRDIYEELHTVTDIEQQMNSIYQGLLNFAVEDCYLSLFGDPGQPLKTARLMLAAKNGLRLQIKENDSFFNPNNLVPQKGLLFTHERYTMIVSSLFYGEEQLGFILYNFIGWEPNPYEDIRMILSSALKNALLRDKMKNLIQDQKGPDQSTETAVLAGKENYIDIRDKCSDFRIQRALDFINEKYNKDITLNDGANKAFMAVTYFSKIFKKTMGDGFQEYLTSLRLAKACSLLKNTGFKISEIARSVGYHDPNYFYKIFKKSSGCTPSEYRKQ